MAELLRTLTDTSQKVTVGVFRDRVSSASIQHELRVRVEDPDMLVIGGGGIGTVGPPGALLTASHPNDDLTAWVVASTDHIAADLHQLEGFALGLKIAGMTRQQLLLNLSIVRARGGPVAHPTVTATLPADIVLVSGGFRVAPNGGNLATASYPEFQRSWTVSSKDHFIPSPAVIESFAIGLQKVLRLPDGPGGVITGGTPIGTVVVDTAFSESRLSSRPAVKQALSSSVALTGIGALVRWTEPGCLLWKLAPWLPAETQQGVQGVDAAAKDHVAPSRAQLKAWAIGIQLLAPGTCR
jgi:hypothetical protein